MDRGAWWATIYRVAKSRTRLNRLRTQHYCVLQSQLCSTITTQANNPREKTAVLRQTGSEVALPKTPTCQSQGKAAESRSLWRELVERDDMSKQQPAWAKVQRILPTSPHPHYSASWHSEVPGTPERWEAVFPPSAS